MGKVSGIILAIIVGICMGLQPAINTNLGKSLSPKIAALHSIVTSFIICAILIFFSKDFVLYKNIVNVHPVYWIGGILGAAIVFFTIKVVPILGASASIGIFVTVQLLIGAIIDHFGLFGVSRSPLDHLQILGGIIMLIGVKLILK